MQTSSLGIPLSLIVFGLGSACGGQGPRSTLPAAAAGAGGETSAPGEPEARAPFAPVMPKGPRLSDSPHFRAEGGSSGVNDASAGAPQADDGEPGAQQASDTTPPSVVSVEPANGSVGVAANARVVIQFSEPMNQRATMDAFASQSLPRDRVKLSWNDAGTALTIEPTSPLSYAHARLVDGEPLELPPQTYGYTLTRFATDLAGNPLPETTVTFSTLREITQTLNSVPSLTGSLRSAGEHTKTYGFVTFDLQAAPSDIRLLQSALVRTGNYRVGAPVPIFDVEFDELTPAAVQAGPGTLIATLPPGTTGDQLVPKELWPFLAADYQHRSPSHHYSQFRLELPEDSGELAVQALDELLAETSLEVDYLLP